MQKPTKEEIIQAYNELRDLEIEYIEMQESETKIKLKLIELHKQILLAKEAVRALTGN